MYHLGISIEVGLLFQVDRMIQEGNQKELQFLQGNIFQHLSSHNLLMLSLILKSGMFLLDKGIRSHALCLMGSNDQLSKQWVLQFPLGNKSLLDSFDMLLISRKSFQIYSINLLDMEHYGGKLLVVLLDYR